METNEVSASNSDAKLIIPYYKLFSFAEPLDIMLMIIGTIGAVANGLAMPIMTVLFGNVIQSFGSNSKDTTKLLNAVAMVSLEFVYLAIATGVVSSLRKCLYLYLSHHDFYKFCKCYKKYTNSKQLNLVLCYFRGDLLDDLG